MMNETIVRIGCFTFGCIATYISLKAYYRLRDLEIAIEEVSNSIPTPEQMAEEVLRVKLPINKLPPDMLNNVKRAMKKVDEENKGKAVETPSYMG